MYTHLSSVSVCQQAINMGKKNLLFFVNVNREEA